MNRAKGELEALSEWLADDMSWTLIEKSTHSGPSAAREAVSYTHLTLPTKA